MRKVAQAALAAAFMLGAAQMADPAAAQQTLKFGALSTLLGRPRFAGRRELRGLELAAEETQRGRRHQRQADHAGDEGRRGRSEPGGGGEARRLTSVENVSVIFGTYSFSLSLAATQVAELAGIPYFELGAVSDPITERGFKYVFRSNATAKDFSVQMVDAIPNAIAPRSARSPRN